ncbi:MAG: FKBP-type peptidyl-prolyl cis-trans isomerase [Bacteroidota bacterium]
MYKRISLLAILCLAVATWGCETANGAKSSESGSSDGGSVSGNFEQMETHLDTISYAIGLDIGTNFKSQSIEVNMDAFVKGLQDGMGDGTPMLSQDQARQVMMAFQRELQAKQQEARKAEGAANLQKSQEFLANNKANNSKVVELPSGLQYEVMKEGTGPKPTVDDEVTTHYHGTLMDGSVFDSSVERGQPASFPLKGVIKAWQEILPMMSVGSKYRIFSPPALAYGEYGSPPKIGPNAALIFEIELIKIGK